MNKEDKRKIVSIIREVGTILKVDYDILLSGCRKYEYKNYRLIAFMMLSRHYCVRELDEYFDGLPGFSKKNMKRWLTYRRWRFDPEFKYQLLKVMIGMDIEDIVYKVAYGYKFYKTTDVKIASINDIRRSVPDF